MSVTRAQVVELLDRGHTFETAARALHVSAGLAYMVVNGVPADASDSHSPNGRRLLPSAQHLVNPPPFNPTRKQSIADWVQARAQRELTHAG